MSQGPSSHDSFSKTSLTLIDQAIGHSEDAWREMMRIYYPLILFWARSSGLNEHDGENVCQEVFSRLLRFLSRFQPTKPVGSFRSWLKTLTHHAIYEHRQRTREVPHSHSYFQSLALSSDSSAAAEASRVLERQLIWNQVMEIVCGEFSAVHTAAFEQVVIEQLPVDQVAANLKISANVVYQAKSRILSRIRQRLDQLTEKCES